MSKKNLSVLILRLHGAGLSQKEVKITWSPLENNNFFEKE